MPNRAAAALPLRPGDRAELQRWLRSSSVRPRTAQRARLVLLAADGLPNHRIAQQAGVSRPTVALWRSRYAEQGLAGLWDRDRPGRPSRADTVSTADRVSRPPPPGTGPGHAGDSAPRRRESSGHG